MHDTVKSGISRRTVVKGAAWSVPAIAVAGAAPAMAASRGIVDFTGIACKWPGNSNKDFPKAYQFEMLSTSSYDFDVIIAVTSFSVNGVTADYVAIFSNDPDQCNETCPTADAAAAESPTGDPATLCVSANSEVDWTVITGEFQDSENAEAVVNYTVYNADTCLPVATGSKSSGVLNTPPCA